MAPGRGLTLEVGLLGTGIGGRAGTVDGTRQDWGPGAGLGPGMEMTLGPGPGRIPGPGLGELQLTPGMEPGPGVRTGADTGDGAGSQHRGRGRVRTGADTKDGAGAGAGPDPLGAAFPFCSRGQRGPAPRGEGDKGGFGAIHSGLEPRGRVG